MSQLKNKIDKYINTNGQLTTPAYFIKEILNDTTDIKNIEYTSLTAKKMGVSTVEEALDNIISFLPDVDITINLNILNKPSNINPTFPVTVTIKDNNHTKQFNLTNTTTIQMPRGVEVKFKFGLPTEGVWSVLEETIVIKTQFQHNIVIDATYCYKGIIKCEYTNKVIDENVRLLGTLFTKSNHIMRISIDGVPLTKEQLENILTTRHYTFNYIGTHEVIYEMKINKSYFLLGFWEHMFQDCEELTSIDVSNCDISRSHYTHLTEMFKNCIHLKEIDLSGFGRFNGYIDNLFDGCTMLQTAKLPTLYMLSDVFYANYVFKNCNSLTNVYIDGFDNVHQMTGFFEGCNSLESVEIGGDYPNSNTACDFANLFYGCLNLKTIKLNSGIFPADATIYNFFGDDETSYAGYNSRMTGENKLYIPESEIDSLYGCWIDPLQNTEKCGFTIHPLN